MTTSDGSLAPKRVTGKDALGVRPNQKHATHSDLMEDPAFWRRQARINTQAVERYEELAAEHRVLVAGYLATAERLERG